MKPLRESFDERAVLKSKIRQGKRAVEAQVRESEGARPNFLHTHPRIAVVLAGAVVAMGVLTFAKLNENGGDELIRDAIGGATKEGIDGVKSAGGVAAGAGGAVIGEVVPDCITVGDAQVGSVDGCEGEKSDTITTIGDVAPATPGTQPEQPDAAPQVVSGSIAVAEGAGGYAVARQCLGLDLNTPITDAIKDEWSRIQSLDENIAALSDGLQTGETIIC